MTETILTSSRGTLVFGRPPFVLHRLDPGAPVLTDGQAGQRTVEIAGYILPAGADAAARAAEMDIARRLVCRIAGAPEGFVLTHGGRSLALLCSHAPQFAAEAPLNGADATFFTLRARSAEADGCMTGTPLTAAAQGTAGGLLFPLAWSEETVLGTMSRSGTLTAVNPGDAEAGFTLTVTAEGGTLSSVTVSRGAASLTVTHELTEGQSLCIDTRPGHKDVTAEGRSILWECSWQSEFFALPPGENTLHWACDGTGHARLSLTLTPRYL